MWVESAHRMSQATSADLPMPWPEAVAKRTASVPVRRSSPSFSSSSRCQGSGPCSPASGEPARPQGKAYMTKPNGSKRQAPTSRTRRRPYSASASAGISRPLARGLELGQEPVDVDVAVLDRLAPVLRPAVAQPEDAGLGVGRHALGVGDRPPLAIDLDQPLGLHFVALGFVVEPLGDDGIGRQPALRHRPPE